MATVSVFAELCFRIKYRHFTFPLEIVMHDLGDWEKQAKKVFKWRAACCPSVISVSTE